MTGVGTVTVRDETTGAEVTCAAVELAEHIAGWYPEAPTEVAQAVLDLQDALLRGEPTDAHEAFLALRVERC